MIYVTNMRVNIITSTLPISLTKNSFIIRKLLRIFRHKYRDSWVEILLDDNTNRLALSGEASRACSEISFERTWFRGERERRGENEKEGRQRWSRSTGIRCSYSRTRGVLIPFALRHRRKPRELGVIRATTAYPSRFPVNKYASRKVNLWDTCAHTFPPSFPSSIPQSPSTSLFFFLLRHKVILVSDVWLLPIFSQNIKERTIGEFLRTCLSRIQIYENVF